MRPASPSTAARRVEHTLRNAAIRAVDDLVLRDRVDGLVALLRDATSAAATLDVLLMQEDVLPDELDRVAAKWCS